MSPAVEVTHTLPSTANDVIAPGANACASTGSAGRYLPLSSACRQICPEAASRTYRLPLKLAKPLTLFHSSGPEGVTSVTVFPSAFQILS